jgi:hypothetical protein
MTAFAQDESEAELKSPLELRLTAQATAFCVGTPLMLELEVTNDGQNDVSINRGRVWKEFSYGYSAPKGKSRSGGMGMLTDSVAGNFMLKTGASYRTTFEFPLTSDFFQEAGTYTLKTSLTHLFSNEVTFELYDCGKPQEVKEQ